MIYKLSHICQLCFRIKEASAIYYIHRSKVYTSPYDAIMRLSVDASKAPKGHYTA